MFIATRKEDRQVALWHGVLESSLVIPVPSMSQSDSLLASKSCRPTFPWHCPIMPVPKYEIGWLPFAKRSYEVALLTSIRHYYLRATGPYPNDSPSFAGLRVRASKYAWCPYLDTLVYSTSFPTRHLFFSLYQGEGPISRCPTNQRYSLLKPPSTLPHLIRYTCTTQPFIQSRAHATHTDLTRHDLPLPLPLPPRLLFEL